MLTVFITSFNTLPFLANAVRSIRKHCPSVRVMIHDNGSTDGSIEFAQREADDLVITDNSKGHHGALDRITATHSEDYLAICDSDIEFTGDPLSGTLDEMRRNPSIVAMDWGRWDIEGSPFSVPGDQPDYVQMGRIDPCCAVIHVPSIRATGESWYPIRDRSTSTLGDVGAGILRGIRRLGLRKETSRYIADNLIHYGNSTWPANGCKDPEVLARVERNRQLVEAKISC